MGLVPIVAVQLFLRIFRPERSLRIVVMDPRLFGHQALEPEVFWNDWQTATEGGSNDYWFCCLGKKSLASNVFLWKVTKQRFPTLPSWFVTSVAHWKKKLQLSNICLLDASIYRLGFLTSRPATLPEPSTMNVRRLEILSRLVNPERPYVVLTIREHDGTTLSTELRNRRVEDMVPMVNALVDRGFNVVRLTSRTRDPLVIDSGHVLDWQVQVDGRAGDELAVISGAAFVVSTTTGGDCLALAYRREVFYLDVARFFLAFLGTELATLQIAKIIDETSGARLNLQAVLERGLGWVGEQEAFAAAGTRVINSNPEEIRDAVMAFLDRRHTPEGGSTDETERAWQDLLMSYHGSEILKRHGPIKARMHPDSRLDLLSRS